MKNPAGLSASGILGLKGRYRLSIKRQKLLNK